MQIYKIINLINNKIYVGKDKFDNPNYYGSGKIIKRAIKKYGIENFKKEILEDNISNYNLLNEREKYWILEMNSLQPKGYNINTGGAGGDNFTYHDNKEQYRKKLSLSQKGKIKTFEHKEKIRISNIGKHNHKGKNNPMYNKHRFGHIAPMYGKEQSKESKDKIRKAHLGMKMNTIHRLKSGLCTKDTFWMNNGKETKRIKKDEINDYLDIGWCLGRISWKNI